MRYSIMKWAVATSFALGVAATLAQEVPVASNELIVSFGLGKYSLSPTELRRVKAFYSTAIKSVGANVLVVGHADQSGDEKLNLELSRKRAQQVARELLNIGLNPAQLRVDWKGEFSPLIRSARSMPNRRNRVVVVKVDH